MNKVLPILFNTDMVRAILDGRKTVTRRICKDANDFTIPDISFFDADRRTYAVHNYADKEHIDKLSIAERNCPICPGDILYVRETWCDDRQFTHDSTPGRYFYKASENDDFTSKWHPSIHMPKEAARIWLKVKDVRVERLQEIDDGQLRKEGFIPEVQGHFKFKWTWNSTIKKSDLDYYGWEANPWVWVIEFERCERPEH